MTNSLLRDTILVSAAFFVVLIGLIVMIKKVELTITLDYLLLLVILSGLLAAFMVIILQGQHPEGWRKQASVFLLIAGVVSTVYYYGLEKSKRRRKPILYPFLFLIVASCGVYLLW